MTSIGSFNESFADEIAARVKTMASQETQTLQAEADGLPKGQRVGTYANMYVPGISAAFENSQAAAAPAARSFSLATLLQEVKEAGRPACLDCDGPDISKYRAKPGPGDPDNEDDGGDDGEDDDYPDDDEKPDEEGVRADMLHEPNAADPAESLSRSQDLARGSGDLIRPEQSKPNDCRDLTTSSAARDLATYFDAVRENPASWDRVQNHFSRQQLSRCTDVPVKPDHPSSDNPFYGRGMTFDTAARDIQTYFRQADEWLKHCVRTTEPSSMRAIYQKPRSTLRNVLAQLRWTNEFLQLGRRGWGFAMLDEDWFRTVLNSVEEMIASFRWFTVDHVLEGEVVPREGMSFLRIEGMVKAVEIWERLKRIRYKNRKARAVDGENDGKRKRSETEEDELGRGTGKLFCYGEE